MTAKTLSRISVALFWGSAVILSILDRRLPSRTVESEGYAIATLLGTIAIIVLWVESDASARGYRVRTPLRFLIVFAGFIGVPAYVVKSRGWRGLLPFAGRFVACLVITGLFDHGLTVIGL